MSSGGSTTTQTRQPYGPAASYLTDIMGQAQNLYRGTQPPPDALTAAWNRIAGLSQQDTSQPADFVRGVLDQGTGSGAPTALGSLTNIAGGGGGLTTAPQYQSLTRQALRQNLAPNTALAQAYGQAGDIGGNYAQQFGNLGQNYAGQFGNAGANYQGSIADLARGVQGQNQDVYGAYQGILGGPGITTGDAYSALTARAQAPTAAEQYLTGMASQQGVNPYVQQMLDAQNARIANQIASQFSGAGRYGSAGQADTTARALSQASLPVLAQQYDAERQRQLAATSAIDAARQAAFGTQLSGIGGLTQTQAQNLANRMGAANALAGQRNTDVGLQASLQGQGFQGGQSALQNALSAANLGVSGGFNAQNAGLSQQLNALNALTSGQRADVGLAGQTLGGLTGAQQQDIANRLGASQSLLGQYQGFLGAAPGAEALRYAGANALGATGTQQAAYPWQGLDQYAGILGNLANNYATTTGQTTQMTPWTQYAGLGLGGLSLFRPSADGTSAASGFLGALGGLPLLSDREQKTDIRKVGTSDVTGLDIYSYRYKGDPKSYPKTIGPMAQDIEHKYPGATVEVGGALAVRPQFAGLLR